MFEQKKSLKPSLDGVISLILALALTPPLADSHSHSRHENQHHALITQRHQGKTNNPGSKTDLKRKEENNKSHVCSRTQELRTQDAG